MLKISLIFKENANFAGTSKLIKNAKFSRYNFQMNQNMQRDFQIFISVPLTLS